MSGPNSPKAGGLWARLLSIGSGQQAKEEKPAENTVVAPPAPVAEQPPAAIPVNQEVPPPVPTAQESVSPVVVAPVPPPVPDFPNLEIGPSSREAAAVQEPLILEAVPVAPIALAPEAPIAPVAEPPETPPVLLVPAEVAPPPVVPVPPAAPAPVPETPAAPAIPVAPAAEAAPTPVPVMLRCPCCQALNKAPAKYCDDCGFMFPAGAAATLAVNAAAFSSPQPTSAMPSTSKLRIKDRYEIHDMISECLGIRRHKGLDFGDGQGEPTPVVIVMAPGQELLFLTDDEAVPVSEEDILPTFDAAVPTAQVQHDDTGAGTFPGLMWEKTLLEKVKHPGLPAVRDHFLEDNTEYLVEEAPQGRSLWDAWDDPTAVANVRYGWLQQVTEALLALYNAGAILEAIQPDAIVVNDAGVARIADLSDLLPMPLPPGAPIRATLYTAPELVIAQDTADGRAMLYSLGASLYALEYLHHGLEEKDFEAQYTPHQITDRYPDVHPLLPRLLNKTFVREPGFRFPSDEMARTDASGLVELSRTLESCRRTLDRVRLDIAAWTTTGMVRTGNEDAFAFLHGVEGRQDDVYEHAMVLLCDGMGGYEAGEVAAALAISEMRKFLLQQPMFYGLAGRNQQVAAGADQVAVYKETLKAALRHANREVLAAAKIPGKGKRGMGCTAEVVYVDNANVIVGHVGDSRTYHLHEGRLVQLTRDQTLVNRLVELGQITAEQAEHHERKNELQQAIGVRADVDPAVYHGQLRRGDWVLVCTDGLTNHITNAELEKMLTREAAGSAEEAARRLMNLVNLRGATDNSTIVVVRAT